MKEKIRMNKFSVINRFVMKDSTNTKQLCHLCFDKLGITLCLVFGDPEEQIVNELNSFNHSINEIAYNFRIGCNSMFVDKTTDVAVMFNLIEYTLDLFRISLEGISVESNDVNSMQQFACHPTIQTVRGVFVDGESFPAYKLSELFDNLKVPLFMAHIFARVEGEADMLPSLFGAEHVFIKKSGWIRKEHLFSSNSRFILLRESNLKEDTLVSFVKQWLNGTDTRFETMIVYFSAGNKIDREYVLNSLDGKPWDPEKRSQKFLVVASWIKDIVKSAFSLYSDCEKGLDIERSDGLLATVKIDGKGYGFFFHVWHNRFHQF